MLARRTDGLEIRDVFKEPLTLVELRRLARTAGSADALVAPKRKKEAAGLSGDALLRWLAEDMGRVRRPLIEIDGELTLGFAADARRAVEEKL